MRKTKRVVPLAIVLSALAVPTASAGVRLEPPTLASFGAGSPVAAHTGVLDSGARALAELSWWGGSYTVSSGETVSVYVSRSYPEVDAVGRQWAQFFAGLPHGSELGLLKAYVAPLDEVWDMCGSFFVVGCYGSSTLVTIGDSSAGEAPASVAAHEYGHHIAANRSNDPWPAVDWGTKRWATAMHICERVARGTAFPGDEGVNYSLNPGEAFAESYRVMIETNGTAASYDWPIVDPSFRPDVQALSALREDVIHPWPGPVATKINGRFAAKGRSWRRTMGTPLDGVLRLAVTVPSGGADDVKLLSGDGRTVLSAGTWNSAGGKSLEYRICGTRSVQVRLTRGGSPARFTLRVARP